MRLLVLLLTCLALVCVAQSDFDKLNHLIDEGQYQDAIREVDQLLNQKKGNEFDLLNRKTLLNISIGNFDEAGKILSGLLQMNLGDFQHAITLSTQGFMLLNKGNFDSSLEVLQQAQQSFAKSGKENSPEAAQNLSYLGTLFSNTGKTKQAEDNQMMALQIRQKVFSSNAAEIAASYNDLGLVYSQADPDKALGYYEKALPIYKKIYGESHAKIAQASTNIGLMYNAIELYGDAQNNFETALAIWKKLYPNGHPNQALTLLNLGRTYSQLNNTKAANAYYRNALAQFKKAYGNRHPDIASAYNLLGPLARSENKFDSALYFHQQALIANSTSFNSTEIGRNPAARSHYNGMVMLYSLLEKAQTLEEKYLNKTIKESDLKLSLSCLLVSDSLVDLLRQKSRDESDKIALGALANRVYQDGVRITYMLSEVTPKPSYYRELAFYFAEKSKAAVLLESIADANAKSFAGIPQNLVDQEKQLKADIAYHSQKLAQKQDAQQDAALRTALFDLNRQYEAFVKQLEANYPEYFNLKFNNSIPDVKTIQGLLPSGTALVSYFIADEAKRLYIFMLSDSRFKIWNRALPDNVDKMIRGLANSIFYSEPETFQKAGSVLSDLLDPKLPKSITDAVIIPSGRLGTVPFEALPLRLSKGSNGFGEEFWINRFAIGYEFSATLLAQKSKRKSGEHSSIFLCAPVDFTSANLNSLPGTEAEVNYIAGLFSGQALLKKSDEATETSVKESGLNQYKYLHFATHGIVDEQSPELSRIFLKPSSTDDGNLFSGEIFNLSLNADLVALSACQTGLGKVSKGEGVIGLSRALVYAGARNVMVSYWSVADESTAQMMTGFYKNILENKNPSYRKALQQVKLKMIAEKKYGAPFYWAPFVVIGF